MNVFLQNVNPLKGFERRIINNDSNILNAYYVSGIHDTMTGSNFFRETIL